MCIRLCIGINIYILNTFSKGGGGRILGEPLVGMMPEEGLVPYLLHFN